MSKAIKKISGIFGSALSFIGLVVPGAQWLIPVGLGVSFAGSVFGGSQIPNLKLSNDASGHLVNTKKIGDYIPVVYGRTRIGGNVFFVHSQGKNNNELYLAVGLCCSSNGADRIKVNSLFFDGEPVNVFKKIKHKSSSKIEWEIEENVTNLKISVSGGYPETGDYVGNYIANFWADIEIENNGTWVFSRQCKAKLENSVLTVETTGNASLASVTLVSFKTGSDWVNSLKDYYEYVYYDGEIWWKFNETNNEWETDTSYMYNGVWQGTPHPVKKVLIENSISYPARFAFVGIKLIYSAKKWQKIPTVTVDITRKNKSGASLWTVAEAIYDFLTNKYYGLGIDSSRMDNSSFDSAIEYCRQNDYYFNGAILQGRAADIIKNLCEHIRADIIYCNGCYTIRIRDMRFSNIDPVYPETITEDDVVEGSFAFQQASISNLPNRIRVKYFDPVLDYKVNTIELSYPGTDDEDDRYIEANLWGYTKEKAEYFANYYIERARLSDSFSFAITHKYIDLKIGDLVKFSYAPFGIDEQYIRITGLSLAPEGVISVSAVLEKEELYNSSMDLNIYEIDLTNLPDPYDVPEDISAFAGSSSYTIKEDKSGHKYILLQWQYEDIWVEEFFVYMKKPGASDFEFVLVTSENFAAISVAIEGEYKFRIVPKTIFGVRKEVSDVSEYSVVVKLVFLGECAVISGEKVTKAYAQNYAPLSQIYVSTPGYFYTGALGKSWEYKNQMTKPIHLVRGNYGRLYLFDKSSYKIFRANNVEGTELELLHEFSNKYAYASCFDVSFDEKNFIYVKFVYDSSVSKYTEAGVYLEGSSNAAVSISLSSAKTHGLAICNFRKHSSTASMSVIMAFDLNAGNEPENIEIILSFVDVSDTSNTYYKRVSSGMDIYNLNFQYDYATGIAIYNKEKIIYCRDNGNDLKVKYYSYDGSSETEGDIAVLANMAGFYIEDSSLENANLSVMLKNSNNERYKINIYSDENGNLHASEKEVVVLLEK